MRTKRLALDPLFMRAIAERLLFREAAATELRVLDGAGDVAICIDEIHNPRNANRSALGIYESLNVLAHRLTLNRDNREVLANVMGDEASTWSLIRSDEYVHE